MSENDESGTDMTAEAETEAEEERGPETVDTALVDRVTDADPESIAREIVSLRDRATSAEDALAAEEARVETLESKVKRTTADFQNYKKRMEQRREEEKARATEELVERLLDVRDNLVRALDQDEDVDIRGGIEKTLDTFDRVLDAENVVTIEPAVGEEVDPQRHEVLLRIDSDHPEGTIHSLQRPGYEMAGKVIRPAQVTVSEAESE
jgi:molecular chaperone GrpE